MWDAVHTAIRPVGGALIAVTTLGEASPTMQGVIALLGGSIAASSHLTKAGARVAINTSPEPFTNWIASLLEDGFVIALGLLALKYPLAALVVLVVLIVLMAVFAATIVRLVRRRFAPPSQG
jgi:hypothetical protein